MSSPAELFELQCQAIRACYPDLVEKLDVGYVITYLMTQNVFKRDDHDEINSLATNSDRALRLLFKVAYRDGGWKHLLLALEEGNQTFLKDKVAKKFQELKFQHSLSNSSRESPTNSSPESPNDSPATFNIPPMSPTLMMLTTPENEMRRHKKQAIIRTKVWKKIAVLGMSSQTEVHTMKSEQVTGFQCAMKVARLIDPKLLTQAYEPHEILMLLEHPNIVQYFDYSIEPHKIRVTIYMEKLQISLEEHITRHKTLPETLALKICKDIFSGLEYIHNLGLLHRDLKSTNILLNADGVAKISDFVASKLTTNAFVSKPGTKTRGTIHFRAPETIKGIYSGRADVWSVGCILVHMLSGNVPNHELSEYQILEKYSQQGRPSYNLPVETSLAVLELVECLLALDTANRPDSRDALKYIDKTIKEYEIERSGEEMEVE